jgi:signal peptidase I
MASALLIGDHVVVDRASLCPPAKWAPFISYRELQRGEPVIFYKPAVETNGEHLILVKRVIGVPGDRLHLRGGIVYLNGIAQNEPYAAKPPYSDYDSYRDDFPAIPATRVPGVTDDWAVDLPTHIEGEDLVVPPDHYFVMGDNRTNSLGGRYWGFVPRANLIGRPLFVYWSLKTPAEQMYKTSATEQTSFAAFGVPSGIAFGNSGVGAVILPGLQQGDVTLSKVFIIHEQMNLKFQADAFNIFNHTNYSGLDTNASDTAFGRLNGAYPPRQMQLGGRFTF